MRLRLWSLLVGKASAKPCCRYAGLQVQQLDDRIVPAAPTTTWSPAGANLLWSNPANWSAGLPDATKVVVFSGMTPSSTFDNTVPLANRTVLGLHTQNGY